MGRLRDWKGKRHGDPVMWFKLHRNLLDTKLCPVVALLAWLSCSGITHGPIFCSITQAGNLRRGTKQSVSTYQDYLKDTFRAVAAADPSWDHMQYCSSHSLRRVAAQ